MSTVTGAPTLAERARQLAWRLDTPAGLAALFAVALALRLLLAPYAGFYGDLRLFQQWAIRLADVGPGEFYVEGQFADYPPGYLYVLWLTGELSAVPGYLALKLPAVLADLALAWIAGTLAARIVPAGIAERWPVRTVVAAAVLFNPAAWGLSAVWGQVDAVPAAFVLGSLLLLLTGPPSLQREIAAFAVFAIAIAMKPQSGFLFPVMGYALYRRYLHRRPRGELVDGLLAIGVAGSLSLALWLVSGVPFGLGPVELIQFYRESASVYAVTSANAFNLWGLVGFWRPDTGEDAVALLGLPAVRLGMLALVAAMAFVLWRVHRAIERGAHEARVLVAGGAILSLLAYALLTRMHERYVFASLAALAPLILLRRFGLAWAALSALFLLNLWYPYAYFNAGWQVEDLRVQPLFDWLLGGFETDTSQKRVWSFAMTAIALVLAWRGVAWAERPSAGRATGPPEGRVERDLGPPPAPRPARPLAPPPPARAGPAGLPETADQVAPSGPARWAPLALVALACVFGLVVLRGETSFATNLNDSAFHQQMVRWADGQIADGRVPLDGWYPYLSLGSSHFHHYQSLPHTVTAYAARVTGAGTETTYLWIQYLLLALWPLAVYAGARLLGWGPWPAAAAAAVSPLVASNPGYGYEHASYTWQGYGVYSQLWAMWLLPLAWGLSWRAVVLGRHYAAAAAALAFTVACHFITGYFALLTIGVWVLVLGRAGLRRRIGRAALAGVGSLVVAAWVVVPLLADAKWTTQSEFYEGTIFRDSYGAGKVLRFLFTGALFDDGRLPVVTALVFVGIAVCAEASRRDARARAVLGAFFLSLVLFFGRPTLGPVLDLLPGFGDVQIHRFVIGVHLAGIVLAGVGLWWLARTAVGVLAVRVPDRPELVASAVPLVFAVAVLAPAWTERADYNALGRQLIREQQVADATEGAELDSLVAAVKLRGDGRTYAGLRGNWGRGYVVGYVPVYAWLAARDVDAIGFTFRTIASLSNDVEAGFDERNPAQYEMFNVRYLILPQAQRPQIPARLLASSGRHRLWQVGTTGYFQVVDRAPAVAADRTNLLTATEGFRDSRLASQAVYPGVAFAGEEAPPPTLGAAGQGGRPGAVLEQRYRLEDGVFGATVVARRPAVALLKASYDPRWSASVDGHPARPVMMAPSLVGVDVPPGRHSVELRYAPYGHYALLLALGALALLALAAAERPGRVRAVARAAGRWTVERRSRQPTGRTAPERASSSARSGDGS